MKLFSISEKVTYKPKTLEDALDGFDRRVDMVLGKDLWSDLFKRVKALEESGNKV